MKILLTGATGFLGSHLLEALCAQPRYEVTVYVRAPHKIPQDLRNKINIRRGEITEAHTLREAVSGQELIIHNAGYARDWGPKKRFYNTNLEGTQTVLRAAKAAGVGRIIMTGTNSVYGEEDNPLAKTEESPFKPGQRYPLGGLIPSGLGHYRESKTAGVRWAQVFAEKNGLALTILEPTWIYGPGEFHSGFYKYVKTIQEGMPLMPGSREAELPVIFVKDLVLAYIRAIENPQPGVQRFLLSGRQSGTLKEFYSHWLRAAGLSKPLYLPRWISLFLGSIMEFLWLALGAKKPPPLTRARAAMFYDRVRVNTDKAKKYLGFTAPTPWDTAVTETVCWYQKEGFL
jgi:nucleoside-diphosphate-sugar epimerase